MKDFLSLKNLTPQQMDQLLLIARELKERPGNFRNMLLEKSAVLLFEKQSLRTRLTFELGMKQLGGETVYFDTQDSRLGERESLYDVAKNLERWFDCAVARTFSHQAIQQLADHANIPVVNALTDEEHPCQALADLFTLQEKLGDIEGKKLSYVGDGNNVCVSLVHAAALCGMSFLAVTPPSHRPPESVKSDFDRLKRNSEVDFRWSSSIEDIRGSEAVYTDTWVSMGQEKEAEQRVAAFREYQVTEDVMRQAGDAAFFMHCLPAHRNQEVVESVIDSSISLVYDQAENRLHVQKAVLLTLLAPKEIGRYLHLARWAATR